VYTFELDGSKIVTSGAVWKCSLENTDTQVNDNVFEDIVNNIQIEQEADDIIDFTESNPFGEP
jgi:hypothetical protein